MKEQDCNKHIPNPLIHTLARQCAEMKAHTRIVTQLKMSIGKSHLITYLYPHQ